MNIMPTLHRVQIAKMHRQQQGAVAILVGITLFVLVGMLALVIDLGHLYWAKAGLQNAADAAALAGAKELDGTAAGITRAKQSALAVGRENSYSFLLPVANDDADGGLIIEVGSCKDDPCMEPIDSINTNILAADKLFFKVDTQQRNLSTWFATLFGVEETATYGLAVAGRVVPDISPIAICTLAPDPTNSFSQEFGFERGVSYDISDANPIGPGTIFWIDPQATLAGTCDGSVPTSLPYICSGKINFTPTVGSTVYTNTGVSNSQLRALDSRFGDYPPQAGCDPATAPSDTNVTEYRFDANGAGRPRAWMQPDPIRQSMNFNGTPDPVQWATRTFADYGVLWSSTRPTVAAGDSTNAAVSSRWTSMYKAPANAATNYPQPSPYVAAGGNGRRIINMAVLSCPSSGGVCRAATVLGVGEFLLQRRTEPQHIHVEFRRMLPSTFADAEVKLFR